MIQAQFDLLGFKEQGNILYQVGNFIAERTSYNHRICLYEVFGFYVELHYQPDENVVSRIESVTDAKLLALYVNDIELEGLL